MAKFVIIVATLFVASMASATDVEREAAEKLANAKEECYDSIVRAQQEIMDGYNEGHTAMYNDQDSRDWHNIYYAAGMLVENKKAILKALKTMEPQVELLTPKNNLIKCNEAIAKDIIRITKDAHTSFHNFLCTEPECLKRKTTVSKCVASLNTALLNVHRLFNEARTDQRSALIYHWKEVENEVNYKLTLDAYRAPTMKESTGIYKIANTVIRCNSEIACGTLTAIDKFISKYNESTISGAQLENSKQKCIKSLETVFLSMFDKIMVSRSKPYYREIREIQSSLISKIFNDFPLEVNKATSLVLSDDPEIFCSIEIVEQARKELEQIKKKVSEVKKKYVSS